MTAPLTGAPLPTLVLYGRPGCHLCDDALAVLRSLLDARRTAGLPVAEIIERDITTNPDWEREYLLTIPVVASGDHELPLATSPARLRAFVADALGDGAVPRAREVSSPSGEAR